MTAEFATQVVADAQVDTLALDLVKEWQRRESDISLARAERAVQVNTPTSIEAAFLPSSFVEAQAVALRDSFAPVYLAGAQVSAGPLAATIMRQRRATEEDELEAELKARFDVLNPQAVAWLDSYAFDLVTHMTAEQVNVIRSIVREGFAEHRPPREMARRLRASIGMNAVQIRAFNGFMRGLDERTDLTHAKRMQLEDRQKARLIADRALTIARTETIRASSMGQQALWQSAAGSGWLSRAATLRKWIVAHDDRLCPICAAMDGKLVTLDAPFSVEFGVRVKRMYTTLTPPLHPRCRCAMVLVFAEERG